jgi:phosphate starvation-inducible protein PhoH
LTAQSATPQSNSPANQGKEPGKRTGSAKPTSLVIKFEDNTLLTELFGEHGRNLARIEQGLNVEAASRGNELTLTGKKRARAQAEVVIRGLYERLKKGLEITVGDVDAAIRMSDAPDALRTKKPGADGGLQIATRKRVIAPRSATQGNYIDALQNNELVVLAQRAPVRHILPWQWLCPCSCNVGWNASSCRAPPWKLASI